MPSLTKELELKALVSKRELLFRRIQNLYDESKKLDQPFSLANFKIRYNSLEDRRKQFEDIIHRINLVNLEIDPNYAISYASIEAFDELYCNVVEAGKIVFADKNKEASTSSETQASKATPRLPEIDIVEFSGDLKEWPIFYETFKSVIHENIDLDDVTKLHYLLGKLSGKALSVCSGIQPSGTNYKLIWNTLVERYQDIRLLANSYLTQILDFKPAQNESVACLNAFLEKFDTAVKALKQLEQEKHIENVGDFILAHLALSKLDNATHRIFESNKLEKKKVPQYDEVISFVKEQAKILSCVPKINSNSVKSNVNSPKLKPTQSFVTNQTKALNSASCAVCNAQHSIYLCSTFAQLTPSARFKIVKEKQLCLNCLSSGHKLNSCKYRHLCSICKSRHHSLLHFDKPKETTVLEKTTELAADVPNPSVEQALHTVCSNVIDRTPKTVLLSTAVVEVVSPFYGNQRTRFLIDCGSQSHFITWKCCQRLKLPISKCYSSIMGIGAAAKKPKGKTHFILVSRIDTTCRYNVDAIVVDKITDKKLPTSDINPDAFKHLSNLPLADDNFFTPSEIDGIIGAELFPYLIGTHKIENTSDLPIALESTLGYLLMGNAPIASDHLSSQSFCCTLEPTVENLLEKFWTIEEVPASITLDDEDLECEKIFLSKTTRDISGRYTVALPFKCYPPNLGDSYSVALHRFLSLEKRFRQSPSFKQSYSEVIQDYLDQNHLGLVSNEISQKNSDCYYIPHHAIYKESSSTPIRVVFDASAKSSNSLSLNDVLYSGEKLQSDIVTVLLNFRLFSVALTSDVRQMYRQIWICPEHRCYQRILWRFSPEAPIETYQLNVVAFGIKASPFLALRTMKQLATEESEKFPLAALAVCRDTYMDDVISSVPNETEGILLFNQLVGLFKTGGFQLVKWSSNSAHVLEKIPAAMRFGDAVGFTDDILKILGFQWHPKTDVLSFKITIPTEECTKRNILSTVARIWDPLGLIAPVSLYAKLLIKDLWLQKLHWDEPASPQVKKLWDSFRNELHLLSHFSVPRHVSIRPNIDAFCIGFADASQRGYGAAVYIRTSDPNCMVTLACAKAKVAPIKSLSIPRLELCAALLLAKLINFIVETYKSRFQFSKILAFTDSKIVLAWLNAPAHRWTTFIANRVAKIQNLVKDDCWFHIESCHNPSDCLSRGLTPSALLQHPLWLQGPSWLGNSENSWPIMLNQSSKFETDMEERKLICVAQTQNECFDFLLDSLRGKKNHTVTFSAHELHYALLSLVRHVQRSVFADEIEKLKKNRPVSKNLQHLSVYLDPQGILRVGGRLTQSNLPFETKHPALLPKKHRLTTLIIETTHRDNLHPGVNTLMYLLAQNFWILGSRHAIRSCVGRCNRCFRLRPRPCSPPMADLPSMRIQQAKPFQCIGIDYAGPFSITLSKHRGVKTQKAYICLIVCCTTKAVHLELVSDLTAEACLAALRRFIARRGRCSNIYSDGGTNFVGVGKELVRLFQNAAMIEHIEWHFNPPSAPHFGGLWEAGVKSVKTHLFRVIGLQILTYEELYTVLVQIEALLNSRPLCVLSSDPNDLSVLTPGHFLTLEPLTCIPDPDLSNVPINRLNRWQLLQRMHQDFWKRWHSEYFHSLQMKNKWTSSSSTVDIGTVVIIKTDNVRPLEWPLGIIQDIFPGKDGIVRVAAVKTNSGLYKRPLVKLCPLPSQ